MAGHSRYDAGGEEGKTTLANKLGLKDEERLENMEILLLKDTYDNFQNLLKQRQIKFNVELLLEIHKYFLGTLYTWAGKIRTVEISKDGVLFCPSLYIKPSLENFGKILKENLPTGKDDKKMLAEKLALIHSEFIAIHPFREGNGRTIRLFLDLLAMKSGNFLIDFGVVPKKDYIKACIEGMNQDYSKMRKIIYKGLKSNR